MPIDYSANVERYDKPVAPRDITEQETVQGQMTGLLSKGSPYIDRARTRSAETANRRGLLNTTMAAQAGEAAAIDAALPIAQADASTYAQSGFSSQQAGERKGEMGLGAELESETLGEQYNQMGDLATLESGLRTTEKKQEYGLMGELSAQEAGQQRMATREQIEAQKHADLATIAETGEIQKGVIEVESGFKVDEMKVKAGIDEKTQFREFGQQNKVIATNARNAKDYLHRQFLEQELFSQKEATRQLDFLEKEYAQQKGLTKYEAMVELEKMKREQPYKDWDAMLQNTLEQANIKLDREYEANTAAHLSVYQNSLQALKNAGLDSVAAKQALTDELVAGLHKDATEYSADKSSYASIESARIAANTSEKNVGTVTDSDQEIKDKDVGSKEKISAEEIETENNKTITAALDKERDRLAARITEIENDDTLSESDKKKKIADAIADSNAYVESVSELNDIDPSDDTDLIDDDAPGGGNKKPGGSAGGQSDSQGPGEITSLERQYLDMYPDKDITEVREMIDNVSFGLNPSGDEQQGPTQEQIDTVISENPGTTETEATEYLEKAQEAVEDSGGTLPSVTGPVGNSSGDNPYELNMQPLELDIAPPSDFTELDPDLFNLLKKEQGGIEVSNPRNLSPEQLASVSYDDIAGMSKDPNNVGQNNTIAMALMKKYKAENPETPVSELKSLAKQFMDMKGLKYAGNSGGPGQERGKVTSLDGIDIVPAEGLIQTTPAELVALSTGAGDKEGNTKIFKALLDRYEHFFPGDPENVQKAHTDMGAKLYDASVTPESDNSFLDFVEDNNVDVEPITSFDDVLALGGENRPAGGNTTNTAPGGTTTNNNTTTDLGATTDYAQDLATANAPAERVLSGEDSFTPTTESPVDINSLWREQIPGVSDADIALLMDPNTSIEELKRIMFSGDTDSNWDLDEWDI